MTTTEQYAAFLVARSADQWYPLCLGSLQFLFEEVERACTLDGAHAAADTGLQVVRALNHVLHRHRISTTDCPHGYPEVGRS